MFFYGKEKNNNKDSIKKIKKIIKNSSESIDKAEKEINKMVQSLVEMENFVKSLKEKKLKPKFAFNNFIN